MMGDLIFTLVSNFTDTLNISEMITSKIPSTLHKGKEFRGGHSWYLGILSQNMFLEYDPWLNAFR